MRGRYNNLSFSSRKNYHFIKYFYFILAIFYEKIRLYFL